MLGHDLATMTRALTLSVLALLSLSACNKTEATATTPPPDATAPAKADDLEGREVVDNWKAQPGDVTVCPISGKKFEVEADSGRYAYQGHEFVFCCSGSCLDKVAADPGKYLDALVEQAGGPASDPNADPDPAANEGGAIDDT